MSDVELVPLQRLSGADLDVLAAAHRRALDGLLTDLGDANSLVPRASVTDLEAMIADGTVSGGMIPKVGACIDAVRAGARSAHLLDGRIPHVVLLELFTDAGIGTMITPDQEVTT